MDWTDSLPDAQPYENTLRLLTKQDGKILNEIYSEFLQWCLETPNESIGGIDPINSIEDLLNSEMYIGMEKDVAITSKLAGLGVIKLNGQHIAPTQLGLDFIAKMNE